MDKDMGRLYYPGNGRMYYNNGSGNNGSSYSGSNSASTRNYTEREYPMIDFRDAREGRSGTSRRMYMESKELHQGKEKKMKDLENYMHELTEDITEMIQDASPEEKQLLQKKLSNLATKVDV
jgi:hypothetical protein